MPQYSYVEVVSVPVFFVFDFLSPFFMVTPPVLLEFMDEPQKQGQHPSHALITFLHLKVIHPTPKKQVSRVG